MECALASCANQAFEEIACENCFLPKYCSAECKELNAESHRDVCRPTLLALKDFITVKDSHKVLGTGTYGEVQLVQNTGSKTFYALKIIRKSLAATMIPLKVLFREIAVHKSLNHPNIVRLIDHLEDRVKIYLVLEYMEKGSLFDLIRKKIKLSESEAFTIFIQVCTGLNYLHQNSLIHRDLKAENLLISQDDVIKICDFGWSAQSGETRVTFCGTLDYMAPEMLKNQPHTNKVDIWALGILFYEMLHGTSPFRAKNPREMARLIAEKKYVLGSHVSANAKDLIRRVLQEDPEARPNIIEILKSPWVGEYSASTLKQGWKVVHPSLGEGQIHEITGAVCTVNFSTSTEELIESEIIRLCTVQNHYNEIISEAHTMTKIKSEIDPAKANAKISPLYKKLGINSNTLSVPLIKPAIKTSSNRNSREVSPIIKGVTFEPAQKRTTAKIPKGRKVVEEVKRSQQLPLRKAIQHDFIGINLSPEVTPIVMEKRGGTPKSRFLQKWSAGIRPE